MSMMLGQRIVNLKVRCADNGEAALEARTSDSSAVSGSCMDFKA